jgi:hypothetical protein
MGLRVGRTAVSERITSRMLERVGSAWPARRLPVVGDPDVGLVVQAKVPLTVDVQQGQPLGKHVAPGLWERHPGPALPLVDRPADPQRLGLGAQDPPSASQLVA